MNPRNDKPASSATPAQPDASDIAIVGIGLRFPGAHGPAEFWSNLRAGIESLRHFDDAELTARGVPIRRLLDPAYVKSGHVLEGMELFDAEFFGFSPKDAAILDPQHRQFLECAWEALEDAGHPPGAAEGPIGIFGGCGMSSYFMFNLLSNPALVDSVGMFLLRHTGNDKDFLTTRVSYCLDLKGPSVAIQTACSTSLVAVHAACQSLLTGECDMALAGGVTLEIPHGVGYLCREGEILSPDGHCRPFDQAASGTSFGSGVGIVALRRLEDALRDGDRIYALVKGSAVNNDGAGKVGYLAPSVDGQAAAVTEALAVAGVDADAIEFVEAHGSGTPIGEPIEVAALTQAFARSTQRKGFCGLGSVKSNIGHLDTAAGVAGLIKAALCLHHGEIPPTPTFKVPNAAIPFSDTPFYVVDRLQPWPRRATPRHAGVNALGVGGTNAHVVLEDAPLRIPEAKASRPWQVLCISARNQRALDDASRRLAAHLRSNPDQELADVAFTLFAGRRSFDHRRVLTASSHEEAAQLLESGDPRRVFTHASGSGKPSVVFLLPGGGAQHPRMGLDLYESEPVFREHVDRGIDEFRRRTRHDLRAAWIRPADPESAAAELERPALQLPAIFILEYALAQLWMSLGVRPSALIGHSLGENTAACLAGVLSFEDALGLVALRGELFELLPRGGMLSVALSADKLSPWLGEKLDLAAVNSPGVSVVSGPTAALDYLARALSEQGIDAQRIPIATAAHSRMVEPILPRFLEYLRSIKLHAPRIPFLSNCTGTWITADQAVSPEYWAAHLRGTVRFCDGIRTLLAEPVPVLLEVGPGKSLASLVRQEPAAVRARGVVSSLRHAEEKISDTAHFLTSFGRLWACGVEVDPKFLRRDERRSRVSLPTYPFQRRRYWIEPGRPALQQVAESSEPRAIDLLSKGFARPVWKAKPQDRVPEPCAAREWLIFLDAAGIGENLSRRLRARGERVITVRDSDDNCRLGPDQFSIAPEQGREGYIQLVRELVAAGRMPQRIVHLWLLTPDESFRPGSNFFHRNQERGFYSLFFLTQALASEGVSSPLHISVVSNGMQAIQGETLLHPGKATVLGPCRVIPREFPGITCASIDLPLGVSKSRLRLALRSALAQPLVDMLEHELLFAPRNAVVALRGSGRFEQDFEPVDVQPAQTNGHSPIRHHAVVLITGGLGGVGLGLASQLARHARARLVLVGRTALPERNAWSDWLARRGPMDPTSRRIRGILECESLGSEVLVACADVTDIEAMRGVIEQTVRRFGALHGVVHAAGVLRDAPILSKSQQEVEEVFAAKVHGTIVLDTLTRNLDLDFLALFSSVSAIVAPPGQVDYAAANSFLDAYAQSANALRGSSSKRRRHTVSVNWGIWNVGMAVDAPRANPIALARGESEQAPRHPLFDSRGSDPDSPFVLRARFSPRERWILDEHRTREGRAIVPGSAYVELARAAVLEAGESGSFEIRDLLLLRPLHVRDEESREIEVELRPEESGFEFCVKSRGIASDKQVARASIDAWDTHAQARVILRPPPRAKSPALAEIEARCPVSRSALGPEALPSAQEHLAGFGPRWQTLREVRIGPGEVLARLELREDFAADLEHFGLHPALLDIATTCALELPELQGGHRGGASLWAPVSYKRVRIHGSLPARVRSWVRSRASNEPGSRMLLFDVVVVDDSGRVCIEIDEFAMHRLRLDLDQSTAVRASEVAFASERSHGMRAPSSSRVDEPARATLAINAHRGIGPALGYEALQRLIGSHELSQVIATTLDLEGLRRQADALGSPRNPGSLAAADGSEVGFERPELDSDFVEPADGIERTLAGFWQELLGVRRVGLRDSFFDLGGHSLIAVRLFARIKKTYQVEFPISLLFEAPTIERCAAAIRQAIGADASVQASDARPSEARFTHLVAMHPGQGGPKTPFILVAGMFGNVLNLRHLAHLLGNERRFYGLQALGLYGAQKPRETFEEMACDYVAELRQVQPHGPYLLGGFSGGGITAYEMAQQLLEAGEEVALLAMLDTSLPRAPLLTAKERARIHWERIRRRGPVYLGEWARDKLRWAVDQITRRSRADAADRMRSEFRSEEIGAAFRRALLRYELRPFPGAVKLFRPRLDVAHILGPGRMTNSHREFIFEDNGWGEFAARVDVHEVPGDHDSMVLEPNVRVLAAQLRKCIQEVEFGSARIIRPAALVAEEAIQP